MSDRTNVDTARRAGVFREGTSVAVRCHFDGSWVEGFEIAGSDPADEEHFWLRRRQDQLVLPATFHERDLRIGGEASRDIAWTPGNE